MAAPMRSILQRHQIFQGYSIRGCFSSKRALKTNLQSDFSISLRRLSVKNACQPGRNGKKWLCPVNVVVGTTAVVSTAGIMYKVLTGKGTVHAESKSRPEHRISRKVRLPADTTGLKLTLYQFQSCPFCCKVRAYLDYEGFSYDVVEVNSVFRTELKWTGLKKVPLLVADGVSEEGHLKMNESSQIISLMDSYLLDRSISLDKLHSYYPQIESKNEKGKKVWDYPNKYMVMCGDRVKDVQTEKERKKERHWREWTDKHLVHMLSPNAYRTPSEALQAFHYFSKVGDWETNFSTPSRLCVIYVGAAAMYVIGKILKRRHNLDDDVRQSLYDACNTWLKAVGNKDKFLGGDKPSLADLSVYGVLNSIEGLDSFQDTLKNTNIGPWYNRMKTEVENHKGARTPV